MQITPPVLMTGYNAVALRHWFENEYDGTFNQAGREFLFPADATLDADTLGEISACGGSVRVGDHGELLIVTPDEDADDGGWSV